MKTSPLAVSPLLGLWKLFDTLLVHVLGCVAAASALTAATMIIANSVFNAMGLSR
jgi:hypothetical protein